MGAGIYRKKGTSKFWMSFKNAAGKWTDLSTGCTIESDAKTVYEATLESVAKGDAAPHRGPATIRSFATTWMEERRARKLESVDDDDARMTLHVLPALGNVQLTELRPKQVQEWVRKLKLKPAQRRNGVLAPRTVRHCFNLLRTMMNDAIAEELVSANPCVLKKGDLPRKVDKDPSWRATAIFTRQEVIQLISDARIPYDRRVWAGLHFLTGVRPGEGSALKIKDYTTTAKPLGRILVSKAMDRKRERVKGTKTELPRDVPVHPVLAKLLEGWLQRGWTEMMGREPTPDDLLIPAKPNSKQIRDPTYHPRSRGNSVSLKQFHKDLELLGLKVEGTKPWRRFYDSRRTFITLCLADGALKDIFKWVTHPATVDQTDEYTAIPYYAKCEQVAKLAIPLESVPSVPTAVPTATTPARKNPQVLRTWGPKLGGVYGTRTLVEHSSRNIVRHEGNVISAPYAENPTPSTSIEPDQAKSDCRNCRKTRALLVNVLVSLEAGKVESARQLLLEAAQPVTKPRRHNRATKTF